MSCDQVYHEVIELPPAELPAFESRACVIRGIEVYALFPIFRYWQDLFAKIPATRRGHPVRCITLGDKVLDYCGPGPWRLQTDQSPEYPHLAELSEPKAPPLN